VRIFKLCLTYLASQLAELLSLFADPVINFDKYIHTLGISVSFAPIVSFLFIAKVHLELRIDFLFEECHPNNRIFLVSKRRNSLLHHAEEMSLRKNYCTLLTGFKNTAVKIKN